MPEPSPDPNHPLGSAQASRIYFLPNLMTAGNLFCGFLAIKRCIEARFAVMRGSGDTPEQLYTWAVWFIIAAVVFDSLDGRLARLGGRESLFGREFDSIADVVSFGVAPAMLVFFLILSPDLNPYFNRIGWYIGFIYLLCAGIRLARFNVITHPLVYANQAKYNTKDFVGLPAPAAAGMVASLALAIKSLGDFQHWMILLPVLMVLISYLMVSTIRYPSFKQVDWSTRARLGSFVAVLLIVTFVFFFHEFALVVIFLFYVLFGLIRHGFTLQRRRRRLRELVAARHAARQEAAVNKSANNPQ